MLKWPDMPEFQHVEITDCFVLSWGETGGDLVFTVEASLWPGHPRYTTPPKGDWTCYRKATLRFPGLKHVEGLLPMSETRSSTDPDGSVDYGTIDSLRREDDGSYRLYGDFGKVTIQSAPLEFRIL